MNGSNKALLVLGLAGAVAASGCTAENPAYEPGPELADECRAGSEVSETFENFERPGKVDLWVVISDGEAMESHQEKLAEAVPSLVNTVEDADLDARAAVSTMDATEAPGLAPLQGGPDECADNLEAVAESDSEDWGQTLMCNLQQGTDGDRRPRPLNVVRQSLIEEPSSIEQFRRDDARLVMLFVSEQDDCSGQGFEDDPETSIRDLCTWQRDDLDGVDGWVDELRETATVEEGVGLAVFSGPPAELTYEEGESVSPVCSSTLGNAYPAPRMRRAARLMENQGLFESICVFDFFNPLERVADELVVRDEVTLCASEPMAHEPLEVAGVGTDGQRADLEFGPEFRFVGPTDGCDNGAIRLQRQGAESIERVEMEYCGLTD